MTCHDSGDVTPALITGILRITEINDPGSGACLTGAVTDDSGSDRHADGDALGDLRSAVRAFATDRDWEQFHTPKNLAMALAGEVGELLAEFQWLTPDESATVMTDAEAGPKVRAEIGDVMIYLVRLADVLGLDLVEAATDKLAEADRRYPVDQVRGSSTKASQ